MNEQQEFIKRIYELTELALDQENVIFDEQLYAIFPEVKDDENKKKVIMEFLKEKHIGLNEKLSIDEIISKDEKKYLDFYLEELDEITPLTPGEREAFMLSAMADNEDAQGVILQDTLKNVIEIAKLYVGQGVLLEDLIGEGNLALITAVTLLGGAENAKEAEGILAAQIMDAMQDLIAEAMDANAHDEKLVAKVEKVSKAARELADTLGRKVTVEELMAEYKMSRDYIINALKLTANMIDDIEIPDELK